MRWHSLRSSDVPSPHIAPVAQAVQATTPSQAPARRFALAAATLALCAATGLAGLTGCAAQDTPSSSSAESKPAANQVLDPADPVEIELWTYYNGAQREAFENLVDQFNQTEGKEKGIVVTHAAQGGVNDLAAAVTESAKETVGAAPMPDAFLSYTDTALVIDDLGKVADLAPFLTDEEKDAYVESFLKEGDIDNNGSLKVFPVAKSTETLQINRTDWETFSQATGTSTDELATFEGMTDVAQRYYEWTDAQTPDVEGDGKPCFGRDAMANYLLVGSESLGKPIFDIQNGQATLTLDRDTMKRLWDNYYVPMVSGWFSADGKYRSDAVKTGDLIGYVGSSSSVVYFPRSVVVDDQTSYDIDLLALPNPVFEGAETLSTQQGAGFVVTKSDESHETAAVEFLKWFTALEQNTDFSVSSGYLPVTKQALSMENLDAAADKAQGSPDNYRENLAAALETIDRGLTQSHPFNGSVEARLILDDSLSDKAIADRAAVEEAIASGVPAADAIAPYLSDEVFDEWLSGLTTSLQTVIDNANSAA